MRIDILTLFPEMFAPLKESVIGRALDGGKAEVVITDIRDYTLDKHKKCDDTPFGGGAGMVMTAQPIVSAITAVDPEHRAKRVYLSPKGRTFCQSVVKEYAALDRILLLCGHYEGVDQRAIDLCIDEELSLGDFVLTGGEIPALAVVDAVLRYVDGVINGESLLQESFADGTLEYPHYTKPREFMGLTVPEVLISGNHEKIDAWRKEQSEIITAKNRPDLIKKRKAAASDGKKETEK